MSDSTLLAWLNEGSPIVLTSEAAAARRRQDFSQRFFAALAQEDLGPTEELHQQAVAQCVILIHDELCALGINEYDEVWRTLPAPTRAALKRYIAMHAPHAARGE